MTISSNLLLKWFPGAQDSTPEPVCPQTQAELDEHIYRIIQSPLTSLCDTYPELDAIELSPEYRRSLMALRDAIEYSLTPLAYLLDNGGACYDQQLEDIYNKLEQASSDISWILEKSPLLHEQ